MAALGHHTGDMGFVIHGGIDGFRRLIVFLKCPTNNKSDTVLDKNQVLSNEIDKGGFAGSRWELGPNDAQRECAENVE